MCENCEGKDKAVER